VGLEIEGRFIEATEITKETEQKNNGFFVFSVAFVAPF
jgi:hypothetical protein